VEDLVLNEPQRRHFAVLLAMLEDALREIEALAGGTAPAGRLTPMNSDIQADTAGFLVRECATLRERVYGLAEQLEVPAQAASASRRVNAALISSVVHLEDSTSDKLAGYGPVHPSVSRLLDPVIRDLHRRLGVLVARMSPSAGA
jgi:hypothetical protein